MLAAAALLRGAFALVNSGWFESVDRSLAYGWCAIGSLALIAFLVTRVHRWLERRHR